MCVGGFLYVHLSCHSFHATIPVVYWHGTFIRNFPLRILGRKLSGSLCGLSGGLCCPPPTSTICTGPPHGGDLGWALSGAHNLTTRTLFSDSPGISSLGIGRYFSLSNIVGTCSSTTSYMQSILWFLIQLGSLISRDLLSISVKILYLLCGFCKCIRIFAVVSLTKVDFKSQGVKRCHPLASAIFLGGE